MKKLFVLILAFVHLGASAGVTMHMHYCMGKAYGWELTEQKGKACGKCGMAKTEKKNKKGKRSNNPTTTAGKHSASFY